MAQVASSTHSTSVKVPTVPRINSVVSLKRKADQEIDTKRQAIRPTPNIKSYHGADEPRVELQQIVGIDLADRSDPNIEASKVLDDIEVLFRRWTNFGSKGCDLMAILQHASHLMSHTNAQQLLQLLEVTGKEEHALLGHAVVRAPRVHSSLGFSDVNQVSWSHTTSLAAAKLFDCNRVVNCSQGRREEAHVFNGLVVNSIASALTFKFISSHVVSLSGDTNSALKAFQRECHTRWIKDQIECIKDEELTKAKCGGIKTIPHKGEIIPWKWRSEKDLVEFRELAGMASKRHNPGDPNHCPGKTIY